MSGDSIENNENNASVLFAGASKSDITPSKGTLVGVDFLSHYARFINDTLYAKALVLKQGHTIFVLVMVDICIMPSDFLSHVKTKITKATGIKKEQITLACTHTHGAGDVAGLLGGAVDIAYRNKLPDLIVKSVVQALSKLRPAKVASGSGSLSGYSLCRRYLMKEGFEARNPVTQQLDTIKTNPFGAEDQIIASAAPVDPEVCFMAIKGLDNQWIAILGNYCSHYAGDWDVDTITADFYGTFAKHLKKMLSANDDFVGIMSYGTGADVNTWNFQNSDKLPKEEFAKTEIMGRDLARTIHESTDSLEWIDTAELKIAYDELQLPIRKPDKSELDEAETKLNKHKLDNLELDEHGIAMIYAREQLLLNEYPENHTASLQALKIGNQIIGMSGGELFTETGTWLKNAIQGHNYFTICLANTYDGYVPPENELEKGGYETWRARSSFLDGSAERKLKNSLVELIQKLVSDAKG